MWWSRRRDTGDEQRRALVARLRDQGYVRSEAVERAMRAVPRELFVQEGHRNVAYEDAPQPIGEGQTISAPHMVAMMCEHLDLAQGMRVLEVGAGSGYQAAVMASMVGGEGQVHSVERVESLAMRARMSLREAGFANVQVHVGDGSLGWPDAAPYHRAVLTCAAPDFPPPILEQLVPGGKILAPLGDRYCTLTLGVKTEQGVERTELGGCVFVPLIGKHGFH